MTDLGQISIMYIIFVFELIAKVPKIKADQNSTKLPKIQKLREVIQKRENLKNLHKNENFFTK